MGFDRSLIWSVSAAGDFGETEVIGGVAKWQCTSLQRWGSWFDSNIRLHIPFSRGKLLMNQKSRFTLPFLLAAAGTSMFPPAAAAPVNSSTYNYYVDPNGNDSNPGTAKLPFQTILRASKASLPGTTVYVAPGVYTGGFKTTMSGTEAQRISYVSSVPWAAKIVPPISSETKAGWDNRGSYVDIIGFQIDGSEGRNGVQWRHGIYNSGSYATIRNNWVHHIALDAPCNNAGSAGIGVDSFNRGIKSEVIGNTLHHIGAPGCRFVKGINFSTSGSVRHNVIHNIGGPAIQMWHDANNVNVTNNTVAASLIGILVGGGDFYHTKGPNDYTQVHNNIVYDNKIGISEQGLTGTHNAYRNNLVFQNTTADWRLQNGNTHTGTVALPPEFVRYARKGSADFRLRSTSPAIGKGIHEPAGTGKTRGKALVMDIGAYQFK